MAKSAFNNKILGIVFLALIVIVGATQFFNLGKPERTFRKKLVSIDTSNILKIELRPKQKDDPIQFKPTNGSWTVSQGDVQAPAADDQVQGMLSTLTNLEVNRVAATESSKWNEYKVTDSLGTQVGIHTQNEAMKLIVGKFKMNRRRRSATSFVRVQGDANVYAVKGFLPSTLNRGFNQWRNQTVIDGNEENWTKLSYSYQADSSFTMRKRNNTWMIANQPVDSTALQDYFSKITNLTSSKFRDQFNAGDQNAFAELTIERKEKDPLTIKAFGSPQKPVLHSSQNPASYFDATADKLFNKLFVGKQQFLVTAGS